MDPVISEMPVNRRVLRAVVSACLMEAGFNTATEDAIETMSEMLNSYLLELSRSTKALCEFSGRSEPLVTDVILAMVEMGANVQSLTAYGKRQQKITLPASISNQPANEPKRLELGTQLSRPSYIPDYLPEFPDAHCYIRTLTHAAPATGYKNVREKAAKYKREVMKALTKFIAKTGDTENLLPDDPYAYPLIADKPKPTPYLDSALLRTLDKDETEDDEADKWQAQRQQQNQVQAQQEKDMTDHHRLDRSDSYASMSGNSRTEANSAIMGTGGLESLDADNLIDNPFLRPINMPGMKSGSKKYRF